MRSGGTQRRAWAAGLALVALVLHILVPVHLAFDLAEALGTAPKHGAVAKAHSLEWRLLARLMGHEAGDGKALPHGHGHRAACPAYGALGTLAGFAPSDPAMLSAPVAIALATVLAPGQPALPTASVSPYRSRAPPSA